MDGRRGEGRVEGRRGAGGAQQHNRRRKAGRGTVSRRPGGPQRQREPKPEIQEEIEAGRHAGGGAVRVLELAAVRDKVREKHSSA